MKSPYRLLPAEKRVELLLHEFRASPGIRQGYILRMVKQGGGFRPKTLQKWPVEQLAREVVRRGMESLQEEIGLLQLLYVELEPELQVDFLDAAGVAHENGVIGEDAEPPLADEAAVAKAADTLVERHGDRAGHYLRTIATYNPEAWPGLEGWLARRNETG